MHPPSSLLQSRRIRPEREVCPAGQVEVLALSEATTLSLAHGANAPFGKPRAGFGEGRGQATYAALDLGTNNCRLLVARPTADSFRVIDAFSRIVRLGEGLSLTGRLSEQAIARTLEALRICRDKMAARGVTRARTIATEACRSAVNGADFVERVRDQLGVELEIVDRETEAHLAAAGVGDLADRDARSIVMFDIGGGSSEIIWLGIEERGRRATIVRAWESMRLGVVSLAEKFGGVDVTDKTFAAMTAYVSDALTPFVDKVADETRCGRFHLLGTSGTVTTVAGVHLNLPRYDRRAVDGLWLGRTEVDAGRRPAARDELRRARLQRLHRRGARRSGAGRAAPSWKRSAPVFPPNGCASPTGGCARASSAI